MTNQRSLERQFAELDALSRTRRLDDAESLRLEKIVRELDYRSRRPDRGPLGDGRYKAGAANG